MRVRSLLISLVWLVFASVSAHAQVKVAHVDSEYIYSLYPEFATAQQALDRQTEQWTQDLLERQDNVDAQFQEYQARELLYTQEERQRKQEAIMLAEEDLNSRRMQYFGPEGELYRQQEQLLRPIQEKVLIAIEAVAIAEGYDYVFDRSGDFVFLFADERHDISDLVLEELGIEVQPGAVSGGLNRPSEPARSSGGRAGQ